VNSNEHKHTVANSVGCPSELLDTITNEPPMRSIEDLSYDIVHYLMHVENDNVRLQRCYIEQKVKIFIDTKLAS